MKPNDDRSGESLDEKVKIMLEVQHLEAVKNGVEKMTDLDIRIMNLIAWYFLSRGGK